LTRSQREARSILRGRLAVTSVGLEIEVLALSQLIQATVLAKLEDRRLGAGVDAFVRFTPLDELNAFSVHLSERGLKVRPEVFLWFLPVTVPVTREIHQRSTVEERAVTSR